MSAAAVGYRLEVEWGVSVQAGQGDRDEPTDRLSRRQGTGCPEGVEAVAAVDRRSIMNCDADDAINGHESVPDSERKVSREALDLYSDP